MNEWDVTEAMLQYGGSFVQQLGRLIRLADASNKARLAAAFPEYIAEYRDLARLKGTFTFDPSAPKS